VPDLDRTIEGEHDIRTYLAARGIDYWRAEPNEPVATDAPAEALLAAYQRQIDDLSAQGGYVTAGTRIYVNKSAQPWSGEGVTLEPGAHAVKRP
jgi:hypothetical protein